MIRHTSLFLFFLLCAQVGYSQLNPSPGVDYIVGMNHFNSGNYDQAINSFAADANKGIQIGQDKLIDSFPGMVMVAECHFQMGRYDEALKVFDTALVFYLKHNKWMGGLHDPKVPQSVQRPAPPWGSPLFNEDFGKFDEKILFEIGSRYTWNDIAEGRSGLMMQAQAFPLRAQEIVACAALAIRHRAEILGPMSQYDKLNAELENKLATIQGNPGTILNAWSRLLYGLALSAKREDQRATQQLQRSILVNGNAGQVCQPLAGVARYEIGRIQLRGGNIKASFTHFAEASHLGYYYYDTIVIEESIRYMSLAHRVVDKKAARDYLFQARENKLTPPIIATINLEIADDMLIYKRVNEAGNAIAAANRTMGNRDMKKSYTGARFSYLDALYCYMDGRITEGDKRLSTAMRGIDATSLKVNHLKRIDLYFDSDWILADGPITHRIATDIYERLLREPTADDWVADPMTCLAIQCSPRNDSFERWFRLNAGFAAANPNDLFEIAEAARAHRFHSSNPFGSRLISLRYLLEAPMSEIPKANILDRHDLCTDDFPEYARLSAKAAAIKTQLLAFPVLPQDTQQAGQYRKLLADLNDIGLEQEAMLRAIALSRVKSPNVFPPRMTVKEIQAALPPGMSILSFLQVRGVYHGFLLSAGRIDTWKINPMAVRDTVPSKVAKFLQAIGNKNANSAVSLNDLQDEAWKVQGQQLLEELLGNVARPGFKQLVVVPDGVLWYLPFEALSVNARNPVPLVSVENITIRYAPTASLGVPGNAGRSVRQETLLVLGKINSKEPPNLLDTAVKELDTTKLNLIPFENSSTAIPGPTNAWVTKIRQLAVFDEITIPKNAAPNAWSPFSTDKSKFSGIDSWMFLPWGGPKLLLMPAFRTPAETGLKTMGSGGYELFLSAMALEANGAQTILISRWKTGGKTSLGLAAAFMNAYPEVPADEAWKRAIFSESNKRIDPTLEPRINIPAGTQPPIANQPFFWGSMMLIDRGEKPVKDDGIPKNEDESMLEKLLQEREKARQEMERRMQEQGPLEDDPDAL